LGVFGKSWEMEEIEGKWPEMIMDQKTLFSQPESKNVAKEFW